MKRQGRAKIHSGDLIALPSLTQHLANYARRQINEKNLLISVCLHNQDSTLVLSGFRWEIIYFLKKMFAIKQILTSQVFLHKQHSGVVYRPPSLGATLRHCSLPQTTQAGFSRKNSGELNS